MNRYMRRKKKKRTWKSAVFLILVSSLILVNVSTLSFAEEPGESDNPIITVVEAEDPEADSVEQESGLGESEPEGQTSDFSFEGQSPDSGQETDSGSETGSEGQETEGQETESGEQTSDEDAGQEPVLGMQGGISLMSTPIAVSDFATLKAIMELPSGDYVITLSNDIEFESSITVPSTTKIELIANSPVSLTLDSSFAENGVNEGTRHFYVLGELTLGNNVVLDGADKASAGNTPMAGGVEAQINGKLIMDGATITKCYAAYGGGIWIHYGAILNFQDGTIKNCIADQKGGGICYFADTDFTMSKGVIDGCVAHAGGGIAIESTSSSTEFEFTGSAEIKNCRTTKAAGSAPAEYPQGAGVHVGMGIFKMTGNSKITDCVSQAHGGAINADYDGTIIIGDSSDSPQIKNCTALNYLGGNSGNGGGIHTVGNVIMNSGTIEGCSSDTNGGGIYMDAGNNLIALTMNGGTILDCDSGQGGGVFIQRVGATFNMHGGTLEGNHSQSNGGGVAIHAATFNMSAGSSSSPPVIDGCTAGITTGGWWAAKGGGLYAAGGGSIFIDGGIIQNCIADADGDGRGTYGSGGGIFLESASTANLQAATITNCQAGYYGGAIFTKNYNNLITTTYVIYSQNSTRAVGLRKPSDDIANGTVTYPCLPYNTITPTIAELGADRMYPLNNLDINYMSYSVIYDGNGGMYNTEAEYERVEEITPFLNSDVMNSGNGNDTATHTVLDNDSSVNGGLFEFAYPGIFGTWSQHFQFVLLPDSEWPIQYAPGSRLTFYDGDLVAYVQPEKKIYALWQKEVTIAKKVLGDYGDLTKTFTITLKALDPWWGPYPNNEWVLNFKHGDTQTMLIYEDCLLFLSEDTSNLNGYIIGYDNGIEKLTIIDAYSLKDKNPNDAAVTLTVENTRNLAVPTGVFTQGNEVVAAVIIGVAGIVGALAVWYFIRRKRYMP